MKQGVASHKYLLGVASVLLTFLLLEIGLRLAGHVPQVIPPYLFKNHPVTGWTIRPDYNETVLSQDGFVTYAVNSQGIRAAKPFAGAQGSEPRRIFLVGDSYVFGQGIDEEFTFARLLENSLQEKQLNVEVVNLGVPGFGTRRSYLRLTEYAEVLGTPDFVLYAFTPNDPVDIVAGRKVVVNGIRIDRSLPHKKLLSYLGHLHYRSRLVGFVLTRLYPSFNPRVRKARSLQEQDVPVDTREDFRAAVTYLTRMHEWSLERRIPFAVLINASSEYSAPLVQLLKKLNVPVLEAEQFFACFNPDREPVDLEEGHWNALGHRCVAQGIENFLLQSEWRRAVPQLEASR